MEDESDESDDTGAEAAGGGWEAMQRQALLAGGSDFDDTSSHGLDDSNDGLDDIDGLDDDLLDSCTVAKEKLVEAPAFGWVPWHMGPSGILGPCPPNLKGDLCTLSCTQCIVSVFQTIKMRQWMPTRVLQITNGKHHAEAIQNSCSLAETKL